MTTPQPTEADVQAAITRTLNRYQTLPDGSIVYVMDDARILVAALAASRRDAERLDWIHNNSRRRAGGDSVIHEFTTPYPDDHTIRAAIDAAEKGAAG